MKTKLITGLIFSALLVTTFNNEGAFAENSSHETQNKVNQTNLRKDVTQKIQSPNNSFHVTPPIEKPNVRPALDSNKVQFGGYNEYPPGPFCYIFPICDSSNQHSKINGHFLSEKPFHKENLKSEKNDFVILEELPASIPTKK